MLLDVPPNGQKVSAGSCGVSSHSEIDTRVVQSCQVSYRFHGSDGDTGPPPHQPMTPLYSGVPTCRRAGIPSAGERMTN